MSEGKPTILLVEDNEDDVFFLHRALRRERCDCRVEVAGSGPQAMSYLGGTGKFADRTQFPLPSLVLLDLKLPYVHGLEVLAWIKQQPFGKDVKVSILTSSAEERDQQRAAELGVDSYHVKPPSPDLVREVIQLLGESGALPAT